MMQFVIDASSCLKWAFEEEDSETAKRILDDYQNRKILLLSPDIWQYEITNALASAVLRKKILQRKATQLLAVLLEVKPEQVSVDSILKFCLKNAIRYHISAYDSVYVTLAERSHLRFITADDKLVRKIKYPKLVLHLKHYSSS